MSETGPPRDVACTACVRVNLSRLRRRLSAEQNRELSTADVYTLLNNLGLRIEGEAWICDGEELRRLLHPDEILETVTTVTADGVTFVQTVHHR